MFRYFLIPIFFLLVFSKIVLAEDMFNWKDCVKEALTNQPDLIAAKESVKQSEADKNIVESGLLPQIDGTVSATDAKTTTSRKYSYGVTGTQLIFDGSQTSNKLRSALESLKAAKESYRVTSATIRYKLRSAFVGLLKAQEMLKIAQSIYKIRKANFDLVSLRYESGREHKGSLLTAQANLAQAKYEVNQSLRAFELSQRQLLKEMGYSKLRPIKVTGDFEIQDCAEPKPDFESLVIDNPSLKNMIAQKNAAEFSLKSAKASYCPTISTQAGANKSEATWPPEKTDWTLAVTMSLPLFEGGLRSAQVAKARATLKELQANERSTFDTLVFTLEQDWVDLKNFIDNVEVQRKTLLATEERSKIAEAQYCTGFIQFDNWTIIEDNLVKAKKSFLDAQANALLAEANWLQAKGVPLENEK